MSADQDSYVCDACGLRFEGEPAGSGLLIFPRGDTIMREEPPLCISCAFAVCAVATTQHHGEEEG